MLRHPYDVVLSCFKQNFQLPGAMENFLSLEAGAYYYKHIMELIEFYTQELTMPIYRMRYEDLIIDCKDNMQQLFDFLQIPWQENVLNYYQAIDVQKNMSLTPSFEQIQQKLYTDAIYKWTKYECYLDKVQDILISLVHRLGYADCI